MINLNIIASAIELTIRYVDYHISVIYIFPHCLNSKRTEYDKG